MASVTNFDLKEAIRDYRFGGNHDKAKVNSSPEAEELLAKLDAIVHVLESIRDSINAGRLDLDDYLEEIKRLTTEVSGYKIKEADLKRLANHVVDRTRIELIKINAY